MASTQRGRWDIFQKRRFQGFISGILRVINLLGEKGVLSTLEGTMSASGRGDIMNTLGDVQYIGGYHDACGGIP